MVKKEEYIDRLLNVIKSLEANVSLAKKEDTLSFSFFRDSFNKGQEISKLIHELEMLQIEDMKRQMEKLIVFLSEEEDKKQTTESDKDAHIATPIPTPIPVVNEQKVIEEEKEIIETNTTTEYTAKTNVVEEQKIEEPSTVRTTHSKNIVLPTYINPNTNVVSREEVKVDNKDKQEPVVVNDVVAQSNHSLSINDVVQTVHPKVDVKRGLSLNDRFFFQRELFNNDREAMNNMMTQLNSLQSRELIEQYLKENTSWNFENENVNNFLDIVSKGLN